MKRLSEYITSINEKLKIDRNTKNNYADSYSWEALLSLNYWDVFKEVDFKEVFGKYLTVQEHPDTAIKLHGANASYMSLNKSNDWECLEIFLTKQYFGSNNLLVTKEKDFIELFGEDVLPVIYNYMCNKYLDEKH